MQPYFFLLAIECDRVVVRHRTPRFEDTFTRVVRSVADLNEFLRSKAVEAGVAVDELEVFNSSTIDFAHEYTSNPATLALAQALRDAVTA